MTGLVVDWMRYMVKKQPEMAAHMHMELVVGAWDMGVEKLIVFCQNPNLNGFPTNAHVPSRFFSDFAASRNLPGTGVTLGNLANGLMSTRSGQPYTSSNVL